MLIENYMWNQPWINTADYSTPGLIVNGIGCLFWVVAYVVLVINIRKKKFVEMPAYVAGANIGWEFVWSFFYHPTTGLIYSLAYMGAFFLDCYIFYSILKYGTKQPIPAELKRNFTFYALSNFVFWIFFVYFFISEGYDNGIGGNSGYIINVILSLQCLSMLFTVRDTKDFSLLFAWCKMLGTAGISVSTFIFYPENQLVHLMAIACFIIDNLFIYTLIKRNGKWI